MGLGKAIRVCRTGMGLTQTRLAELSEISVSYLSLLEKDKRDPSLTTVKNLASALKIPLSVLMFLASEDEELKGLNTDIQEKLSAVLIGLISNSERLNAA